MSYDNLTKEELELLTPFDCVAFDLYVSKCKEKEGSIPPAWLCMSEKAREEICESFFEYGVVQGYWHVGMSESDARRFIARIPEMQASAESWRQYESDLKKARDEGNPRAFFVSF